MVVSSLDMKLFRDLWRMRVQALAVTIVIGCGAAIFIMALGMRDTLARTRADYYAKARLADMAAPAVRVPERLAKDIAQLPGVQAVETRVIGQALLDLPGERDPLSARIVSLPATGRPTVNDLVLKTGRLPDPRRSNEAVLNSAFADANGLGPGALLSAVIHGRKQTLRVVGVADSPEFVYVAAPGEFYPQPKRFGVIWMGVEALARAYDLDGAFNEAVLKLAPGADRRRVAGELDALLRPYGGGGAYGRDRMASDRYLTEELKQLGTMAATLPPFFLVIAAFLVAVSQGRLVETERSNIGLLKAFGYSRWRIGLHYIGSAALLATAGCAAGYAGGLLLGQWMADLYRQYYRFPELEFIAGAGPIAAAFASAFAAAIGGGLFAALRAAALPPAQALNPPSPTAFTRAGGAAGALSDRLDAKSRIIARRIVRFPGRSIATALGFGLAISILVVTQTFPAAIERVLEVNFQLANRQDASLTFSELRGPSALYDVGRLPGVFEVEPFRVEDITFTLGSRTVRETLIGAPASGRLSRIVDAEGRSAGLSPDGVTLSHSLAIKLNAQPGDVVTAAMNRGSRRIVAARVAAIAEPLAGAAGYMEIEAMSRLLGEPYRYSGAYVRFDPALHAAFSAQAKRIPTVAGVSFLRQGERAMRQTFDEGVGRMNLIYFSFAAIMAGGVAFSSARVTFAEQQRDLATLRVLGFTRSEASYVLVGEILTLFILSIPFGLAFGLGFARWLMTTFETDLYAFPFVYNTPGYALAVLFTLACVVAGAFWVRGEVDRLDMVGVLKSRD